MPAAGPVLQCCDPNRAGSVAPVLVFGYGNPSRVDDALGPLLIERLQRIQDAGQLDGVELLTDFQLQVEHVLDLVGRERVILADAALDLGEPCLLTPVAPAQTEAPGPTQASAEAPRVQTLGWTSHQMTPAALARLYVSLYGESPPLEQLAIGAEAVALGTTLSALAERNLTAASTKLLQILGATSRA